MQCVLPQCIGLVLQQNITETHLLENKIKITEMSKNIILFSEKRIRLCLKQEQYLLMESENDHNSKGIQDSDFTHRYLLLF